MVKQYSMATTTIHAQKPESYEKLEGQFKLIRYFIPDSFHSKNDSYKLMYIELHSQLLVPYLPFTYDKLDGATSMVIYALYPREVTSIAPVVLSFISDDPLDFREIGFDEIGLFNLVKLLQANYFRRFPNFASAGKFYIHAKQTGETWHTCMEIEINGSHRNYVEEKEQVQQDFWITGRARHFNRPGKYPDEYQKRHYPYYKRRIQGQLVVFEQLSPDELDSHKDELFQQYIDGSKPAHLVYHAQNAKGLQPSRGYLLHRFTKAFVAELRKFGILAKRKERTWTNYVPQKMTRNLPVKLSRIYLYDNRENQITLRTEVYRDLLQLHYGEFEFVIIKAMEQAQNQPTLILLDTKESDYEVGGLFAGEDPYKKIAREFPNTPRQNIIVNENSNNAKFKGSPADYLEYSMIKLVEEENDEQDEEDDEQEETEWAMKLQVCFLQLYLKNVVINLLPVSLSLPVTGKLANWTDFSYIRKQTYDGNSYHVMMKVADNRLHFYDLNDPEQKAALWKMMEGWQYDWDDLEQVLLKKYHKDKQKNPDVKRYDLILKPDLAIELETVDETILYQYDEIERRFEVRKERRPLDDFKLAPHYDRLKSPNDLSLDDMRKLGLLEGREPHGKRESESFTFLKQLQGYDELLDELALLQSRIAYDELVEMRNVEIGEKLKLPRLKSEKVKYKTNRLLGYYKEIWNIGGFKSEDVQISKGIWFDGDERSYVVGDMHGFDTTQDRGNLIRRFDVLIGDKAQFDIPTFEAFLEATAVQFIRYKQYTVYPYPFYLIDKYIKDVLYHQ